METWILVYVCDKDMHFHHTLPVCLYSSKCTPRVSNMTRDYKLHYIPKVCPYTSSLKPPLGYPKDAAMYVHGWEACCSRLC